MLSAPTEQVAVGLHEFADEEESVERGDAVADEVCNHFALGASLLWGSQIVPQRTDLLVVFLDVGLQFILAELDVFECVVDVFCHVLC